MQTVHDGRESIFKTVQWSLIQFWVWSLLIFNLAKRMENNGDREEICLFGVVLDLISK